MIFYVFTLTLTKTRSIITIQRFKGYVPTFVPRKYQNVIMILTLLTPLKQKINF